MAQVILQNVPRASCAHAAGPGRWGPLQGEPSKGCCFLTWAHLKQARFHAVPHEQSPSPTTPRPALRLDHERPRCNEKLRIFQQ